MKEDKQAKCFHLVVISPTHEKGREPFKLFHTCLATNLIPYEKK